MDPSVIGQFIGTIGFPIFAFLLIWKQLSEEREAHKQEMQAMTTAVNNNTTAIVTLTERLNTQEGGKH